MAWTCNICHYSMNSDDAMRCIMCNAHRPGTIHDADDSAIPPARPDSSVSDPANPPPNFPDQSTQHTNSEPSGAVHGSQEVENPGARPGTDTSADSTVLRGRVSHVEQRDERPPFNIYRTLTWVLVWILIGIPFILLFAGATIISFSFAVIGFRTLSQFFNPLTWTLAITEIMEVIVLRRFRSDDRIPVFRGMVEDRDSREHSFMMFGPLERGNIFVGQNIELSGQWHQGSFMVQNGLDLTTGARITSAYRNPWRVAFFVIAGLWLISCVLVFLNLENIGGLLSLDMAR